MSGGVGVLPGLGEGGFGDVGEAAVCFQPMAKTMKRLGEIRDNAEADSINVERYVKELSLLTMDRTRPCGIMFEHKHIRFIAMFSTTKNSGGGGGGFHRGVMEHRVIMNLRAAVAPKSSTALVQVGGAHDSSQVSQQKSTWAETWIILATGLRGSTEMNLTKYPDIFRTF